MLGRTLMVLAVSLMLQAQGPAPRVAIVGHVVDGKGAPVDGANVGLAGSESFPRLDPVLGSSVAVADLVEVVTDSRGQFVAKVLEGREYDVWATLSAADGTFRLSRLVSGVRAGSRIRIEILEPSQPRQRAVIVGENAWPDHRPLRIARVGVGRHLLAVQADAEGLLPAMPWVARFQVVDREDAVLWDGTDDSTRQPDPKRWVVPVPPPRPVAVLVCDEKAKPIADAEVWLEFDVPEPEDHGYRPVVPRAYRRLGVTDARGRGTFVVPALDLSLGVHLLVRAKGFALQPCGFLMLQGAYQGYQRSPMPADGRVLVNLSPARPVTCSGAAGRALELICRVPWGESFTGTRRLPITLPFQVDAAGRGMLPMRPGGRSVTEQIQVVRAHGDGRPDEFAVVPAVDPVAVELAGRRLRVAVRMADGGLPVNARAFLMPVAAAGHAVMIPIVLDRAGRAEVLLGSGEWFLFAHDGMHAASRVFADGAAQLDGELALVPLPIATFRLAAPQAGFVADADVYAGVGMNMSGRISVEGRMLQPLIAEFIRHPGQPLRTDARGFVRIPVLVPEVPTTVSFNVMGVGSASQCALTAGEQVEIQLQPPLTR